MPFLTTNTPRSAKYITLALTISTSTLFATGLAFAEKPAVVDDETRGAARAVGMEGVAAFQEGDYDRAHERLERAYRLLSVPSLGLWSARALEKKGLWVQAAERYLKTTRLPLEAGGDVAVQAEAKSRARAEREALLPRIPSFIIQLKGLKDETVRLMVNQVLIDSAFVGTPRPANPGVIEVRGVTESAEVTESVHLKAGQHPTIVLDFSRSASLSARGGAGSPLRAPPAQGGKESGEGAGRVVQDLPPDSQVNWQLPAGWVGVGVGAAGLLTAGGFFLSAISLKGDLDCDDENICLVDDSDSRLGQYKNRKRISAISFWGGGIVAAAGVTLVLTAPKNPNVAYISPFVGLNSAGIKGAF